MVLRRIRFKEGAGIVLGAARRWCGRQVHGFDEGG